MGRKIENWGEDEDTLVKKILKTETKLDLNYLCIETGFKISMVRKHVGRLAKKLNYKVPSIWTKEEVDIIPLSAEELGNKKPEKDKDDGLPKKGTKRKKGANKFKFECSTPSGNVFISISADSVEEAEKVLKVDYPHAKILKSFTLEEYNKIKPKVGLTLGREFH